MLCPPQPPVPPCSSSPTLEKLHLSQIIFFFAVSAFLASPSFSSNKINIIDGDDEDGFVHFFFFKRKEVKNYMIYKPS
jgi:hypothetical protein